MATRTLRAAARPRAYVGVRGRDATDYLQRMLSNDVAGLAVGTSCEALLLTARARVIAPLVVLRRGTDDFLLLTEPELGERVAGELSRARFAAKVQIAPEAHTSTLVFGGEGGVPTADFGEPAVEVLDADVDGETVAAEELERLRI